MWIKEGPDGPDVGAQCCASSAATVWEHGRSVRRAAYFTTSGRKECDAVRILPVLHFSTSSRRFLRRLDFLH
jgi:hypothetical protein